MSTHQFKVYSRSFPLLCKSSFVALYVQLLTNTGADKITFCTHSQRKAFKDSNFQAITSVGLSAGRNFTKGNVSLLSAAPRSSLVQEGRCLSRTPTPTNIEWRKWLIPSTFQIQCRAKGKGSALLPTRQTQCSLYLIHSTPINIHTAIKYTFTQRT
ncbi:hypothetical protein I79_001011 [Cricetulus griseus]|uniref:Uncharacterized protein n=1 Tax=Cricetulus griseus TaxID=10029 RepID=G3GTM6_CRIGR|nr:hypothetical protein I79_001011 [Cricetulus griseus]